jgi:hypothetical protein
MNEQINPKQDELIAHEGRTATFMYNKNLDGIVIINDIQGGEVEVSGEDLIIFMAEAYVKPRYIQSIEETPPEDLLLNQLTVLG